MEKWQWKSDDKKTHDKGLLVQIKKWLMEWLARIIDPFEEKVIPISRFIKIINNFALPYKFIIFSHQIYLKFGLDSWRGGTFREGGRNNKLGSRKFFFKVFQAIQINVGEQRGLACSERAETKGWPDLSKRILIIFSCQTTRDEPSKRSFSRYFKMVVNFLNVEEKKFSLSKQI